MAKKIENQEEGAIDVTATLGKAEQFIEKNKKALAIIVGAVVLIVGGYFGYQELVAKPREESAQKEMFQAQYYFAKDSFKLALDGDSTAKGFLTIIEDYSGSKAANLAHHYAGICYLNLGKFDDALAQLEGYSNTGDMFVDAQNIGLIGDVYMEKGQVDEAIDSYKKAADKSDNDITAPVFLMKAAIAYEGQKKYAEAIEMYEKLKNDYYNTPNGEQAEKLITRAKILGNIQ